MRESTFGDGFKAIMLLTIFIMFTACDRSGLLEDSTVKLTEEESYEIVKSDEFQSFIQLNQSYHEKIIKLLDDENMVDIFIETSISSIKDDDYTEYYKTVFGSYHNGKLFMNNLQNARDKLFSTFPVISDIKVNNRVNFTETEILTSLSNISYRASLPENCMKSHSENTEEEEGPVCGSYWQVVKLAACSAACSGATSGIGTPLCGWACWCMLCNENSAVADTIC